MPTTQKVQTRQEKQPAFRSAFHLFRHNFVANNFRGWFRFGFCFGDKNQIPDLWSRKSEMG